jgi:hypothetical protein
MTTVTQLRPSRAPPSVRPAPRPRYGRSARNKLNIYASQLGVGGTTWARTSSSPINTPAAKGSADVTLARYGIARAVWQDSRNVDADIYAASIASGVSAWLMPECRTACPVHLPSAGRSGERLQAARSAGLRVRRKICYCRER